MFSEEEVSLFYKYVEKSEEKIFRRGDYRADLWLFRGRGGVCFENIGQNAFVYIV